MKKLLFLLITCIGLSICPNSIVNAQGVGINISGNAPDPSAILDASSHSRGVLISRMSTAERGSITSPALGLLIFNTDCSTLNFYNGGSWIAIGNTGMVTTPGVITGSTTVCQNATGVSYSIAAVAGATGYNWVAPTGATVSTGQGTTSITVNFGTTSGNVCVSASSVCGSSNVSCTTVTLVAPLSSGPTAGTNTASQNQIVWNWNTVAGATGYRYSTVNNPAMATDNGSSTSFTQNGLACNTAYTLYVWAYNVCGNSPSTTLTQSTPICCGTIALDATNQLNGSAGTSFTINTTNPNEIIVIGVNGCCNAAFNGNGSLSVTGAGSPTFVNGVSGSSAEIALYACVATATGSHTITINWGTNYDPNLSMAYAASFTGFCNTPTVAANIQSVTATTNNGTLSASITPSVANSCLFGDYYNYTVTTGTVTWTNDNLVRTDCARCGVNTYGWDGSIANKQLTGTSQVTVTASDNQGGLVTALVLIVVHP